MALEKRFRTYSEKTTSIEQPIEVVQYGRFVCRISSSGVGTLAVILPTTVLNVKSIKLTPLSASAARFKEHYCDMVLYTASNPLVSAALSKNRNASGGNTVLNDLNIRAGNVGASDTDETIFCFDKQTTHTKYLYESQKSGKITVLGHYHPSGISKAEVASVAAFWKKNTTIASNGKNYLKVIGRTTAPGGVSAWTLHGCVFAYEVRGYE